MNETRYWLWLSLVFGAGNPRVWQLLDHFDSAHDAFFALREGEVTGLTPAEERAARTAHLEQVDAVIEYCQRNGITITAFDQAEYPAILRSIYNPPLVLFSLGHLELLRDYIGMTVVGTRHPSPYSLRVTEALAGGLAECGMTIVSGFALGVDSAAHRAALRRNLPTVAVLGCGINVNYPKENAELKEQMTESGLILTEFLPGTQPMGSNFPKRNRVLSGLSLGTVVVEAAIGSGSLITAEHAADQGRDVFCVPPADILDRRYAGVFRYLRDGAIPVFTLNDILNEYYTTYPHKLSTPADPPYEAKRSQSAVLSREEELPPPAVKPKKQPEQSAEPEQPEASAKPKGDRSSLDLLQTAIVNCLEQEGKMHADVLATRLELSMEDLMMSLTELELMGVVTSLFGKVYELN
ncbi:DNA-processing protein DprA [Ruminococcus champanellensis]|uniref:DNA-processing protein DprA n=1 Tax=Ruminococcus champanellensis TaxID=1161942 RepID=UPI0039F52C4D